MPNAKEMKRVTIKDVAKAAGVSFKTVSRVINNDKTVKPANQEKILKAIKDLNYQVDTSARNLRSNSSFTIGLVYDRLNAFYVANIQSGAIKACDKANYGLQILPMQHDAKLDPADLINTVVSARISGLIITPPFSEMAPLTQALRDQQIPFIRIVSKGDRYDELSPVIGFDDTRVGYELTDHLMKLGHRDIAFFWGQETHRTSKGRYKGYLDALADNNIALKEEYVLKGEYTFRSGFERGLELFSKADKPSAIVASNDEIAAGAIAAAYQCGMKVPEELSIVGVKSSPIGHETWPGLTGFDLDAEEIAAQATQLLIDHLGDTGNTTDNPEQVDYQLRFVVRGSTAKAP